MIQKIKKAVLGVMVLLAVAVPTAALPVSAAFAADDPINSGLKCGVDFQVTPGVPCADGSTASTANLQSLLNTVINIFSLIVGVIAVIMIIVGGLRYITSGGDSGKVGAAKTTIIYALVGLVIVALAQLIVHFVLAQASSVINGGGGAAI